MPVHQTGARRRVGQRHHDHHLVGIGHHHPFGGVGVIGGAAQHRSPVTSTDDPRQVSGRPDRSPTTSTSSPTTIGVRPSSRARIAVTGRLRSPPNTHPHRPRSTVTTMAGFGVGVLRGGSWCAGANPPGPDMHIGLVVVPAPPDAQPRPSMPVHSAGKSGSVLAVVAMSCTCTPEPAARYRPRRGHPVVGVGCQTPPCSGVAVITSPSGVSAQFPPSRLISALSAASQSVSCPRRCAMPVSRETEPGCASAASAATDG